MWCVRNVFRKAVDGPHCQTRPWTKEKQMQMVVTYLEKLDLWKNTFLSLWSLHGDFITPHPLTHHCARSRSCNYFWYPTDSWHVWLQNKTHWMKVHGLCTDYGEKHSLPLLILRLTQRTSKGKMYSWYIVMSCDSSVAHCCCCQSRPEPS